MLSQLHKERQSVAEERTKLNVSLTVQREESEDAAVKLAQVYKYSSYSSDITSTAQVLQEQLRYYSSYSSDITSTAHTAQILPVQLR